MSFHNMDDVGRTAVSKSITELLCCCILALPNHNHPERILISVTFPVTIDVKSADMDGQSSPPVAAEVLPRFGNSGRGLTPDRERWAEALIIMRQRGTEGPTWVAERIGVLATAGDMAGVARFRHVADIMEQVLAARVAS